MQAPQIPQGQSWKVRDFEFECGQTMPELRLHYATLGNPDGEPVLLLHGTLQSGAAFFGPQFGGELFGPGQPLDTSRYFLIAPDASAPAAPASHPTACARAFHATPMVTWCAPSTGW